MSRMITSKTSLCWCGILTLIICASYIIFKNLQTHNRTNLLLKKWHLTFDNKVAVDDGEGFKPKFAYITQTEKCIPPQWLREDHIGNITTCNCHVYVVSYRQPCDTNSSPHVFYLHNTTVGWSGGRNIGYYEAKKHGYLYYILFDDDVIIEYNKYTSPAIINSKIPPLRVFEEYLLNDRPAAAGLDYNVITNAATVLKKWHEECKKFRVPRTLTLYHFDMIFNAFHKDTTEYLLPYYEKYDRITSWFSQQYICFKFQLIFYGRFEYFPIISARNQAHRYNTVGHYRFLQNPVMWKDMVETIREQTWFQYQNHSRFDAMISYFF